MLCLHWLVCMPPRGSRKLLSIRACGYERMRACANDAKCEARRGGKRKGQRAGSLTEAPPKPTERIVYVQVPDQEKPTFEGREIVLGPRAGDYYLVGQGLHEGELVVTNGSFKIDAELQIQARPSMMTPQDGPAGGAGVHKHGH